MYISSIHICQYRCFKDTVVEFQPGLNVIIGENNSGKTALSKALMLVFDRHGRTRPTSHDFSRLIETRDAPPTILVEVIIRSSATDTPGDRALVASWLTRLETPWEAQLTYNFFLPEQHLEEFKKARATAGPDRFFEIVEEYLPKYVSRVYAGNPNTKVLADSESLTKFDCQFLDALRDVESEMFAGSAPLFRSMLEEVLDIGIDEPQRRERRQSFRAQAATLRAALVTRLDTVRLFKLATETGAADGGSPTLGGAVDENDLIAALRLFVARESFSFPATHNGLGYNNLIYISLVLASLSFRTSTERRGQNAAIFPMLLIEEPEAHLHPALQYKLLSHIVDRVRAEPHRNRQVFVTTHSTHITAAAGLAPIICLSIADDGTILVSYPARLFPDTPSGRESRGYVERYLDATKSAMLFAKATLFVEGITEQLVVPAIARLLNRSFDANHVAVVRVDGITFKHFLPLFGAGDLPEHEQFGLRRKVACLVDADPARRKTNNPGARWKSCFPFQLDQNTEQFTYRPESGALASIRSLANKRANIGIFSGLKTFEYDLALANHGNSAIVSDAMDSAKDLRTMCASTDAIPVGLSAVLPQDVIDDLASISDLAQRKSCHFAALYLSCAEDAKGEHAFALEQVLSSTNAVPSTHSFICPAYIRHGIEWVTPGCTASAAKSS
jgi:putative ATP-dependent endonuclease of the OLD family